MEPNPGTWSESANRTLRPACRASFWGAVLTLLGTLSSGPMALAVLQATHPQPSWQSPELFIANYHPVQLLPFGCGFLLVSGFALLLSGMHAAAPSERRAESTLAMVFTAAFATLIFFNYIVQTTFVPALVKSHDPAARSFIGVFSMSNPSSLAWGLEMWGYALLGVATWLMAPLLAGGRVARAAAHCFKANGIVSLAGGVFTAAAPGWVMTRPGMLAFVSWNVLVIVMAALALAVFRSEARGSVREQGGAPRWPPPG